MVNDFIDPFWTAQHLTEEMEVDYFCSYDQGTPPVRLRAAVEATESVETSNHNKYILYEVEITGSARDFFGVTEMSRFKFPRIVDMSGFPIEMGLDETKEIRYPGNHIQFNVWGKEMLHEGEPDFQEDIL